MPMKMTTTKKMTTSLQVYLPQSHPRQTYYTTPFGMLPFSTVQENISHKKVRKLFHS